MRHPCVLDWWHLRNAQYTLRREWYTGEWKIYTFTLVFLSMNSSFHSTFLPYVFVYATQYARTYLRILPWSPNWMVESAFRSPCSHSCRKLSRQIGHFWKNMMPFFGKLNFVLQRFFWYCLNDYAMRLSPNPNIEWAKFGTFKYLYWICDQQISNGFSS